MRWSLFRRVLPLSLSLAMGKFAFSCQIKMNGEKHGLWNQIVLVSSGETTYYVCDCALHKVFVLQLGIIIIIYFLEVVLKIIYNTHTHTLDQCLSYKSSIVVINYCYYPCGNYMLTFNLLCKQEGLEILNIHLIPNLPVL